MRAVFQYLSWSIGLPLELLIIGALLRGSYRRFPLILLYSVALFLTTVVEISVSQEYYSTYYWIDEALRQALLFAVVISLMYLATSNLRSRRLVRAVLIVGAIILASVSLLVHYESHAPTGRWMTQWVRDIDFAAAILDLGLWSLLLSSRYEDTQLLMLSGGLGIQFTGEAIGHSLRHLVQWSPLSPGDIVDTIANLAALWIMWQALRRPLPVLRPAPTVLPPSRDETGVAN